MTDIGNENISILDEISLQLYFLAHALVQLPARPVLEFPSRANALTAWVGQPPHSITQINSSNSNATKLSQQWNYWKRAGINGKNVFA